MILKHHEKLENTMYYKRILTSMFPVLYSPNETVPYIFLAFFVSWIRIQEACLYADPCGSESETLNNLRLFFVRVLKSMGEAAAGR